MCIDELLCVRGLLANASYPGSRKFQLIISNYHPVMELIINHCNDRDGYKGISRALAVVIGQHWIVKKNSTVRIGIWRWVTYHRMTAPVGQQLVVLLPFCPTKMSWSSFFRVGLDYFGPTLVGNRWKWEKPKTVCSSACKSSRFKSHLRWVLLGCWRHSWGL